MQKFQAFAQPWWVNLLIIVPFVVYFLWRRKGLRLAWRQMLALSGFAVAFGFVEAAVVVYLRAAMGLLPGYQQGTFADVRRLSSSYQQASSVAHFSHVLITIELLREAATMVMLICVALLAAREAHERWASFFWAFAVWDITYYAGLWAIVRWPPSLKTVDVLFLIPTPWIAQVWYPLLVSALTLAAIALLKANIRAQGSA
ncbi:MAG TPA: hypothetical protein VFP59_02680 [Candidatus Angelobacter sp.]|nr:hypothetical protein [Candidatus Angelobacter sp.]